MKGRVLLILFAIAFAVILRYGSFPIRTAICVSAFVLLAAYLSRDIFILVKSKGHDIRLSKWELDAKEQYSYKTVISLYLIGILMLGISIIIGIESLNYLMIKRTLTDSGAFVASLGLVTGLAAVLAIIQARHIKYILYIRKINSRSEKLK